jgi:hypothetical protein
LIAGLATENHTEGDHDMGSIQLTKLH